MITQPPKAKKTQRNQPAVFDESLAESIPLMMGPSEAAVSAPVARTHYSPAQLALGTIWVLAAICAGVGVGMLLRPNPLPVVFDPGTPIASANLEVTAAAAPSRNELAIVSARPVSQPNLAYLPSTAVAQAQAGTTLVTASLRTYQPGVGSGYVQPGYLHYGMTQGNLGTASTR